MLGRALEALERDEREAALALLLNAWRLSRTPGISAAISRLSADLQRGASPLGGKGRAAFQVRWLDLEMANRAVDMGVLCSTLSTPPCGHIEERLYRLTRRPPDPRLGQALCALIERACCLGRSALWSMAFDHLDAQEYPRAIDALRKRLTQRLSPADGKHHTWFFSRVRASLERLERRAPAQEPALLEALNRQLGRLEVAAPSIITPGAPEPAPLADSAPERALLSAVLEAPRDDGPRQVYADWLIERGAPRGEFINLQLRATLGEEQRARIRSLEARHGRAWLGAIEPAIVPESFRFKRGFLGRCRARFRTEQQRALLLHHPMWATVESLEGEPKLIAQPHLRALREVEFLTWTGALEVDALGPPAKVEALGLSLEGASARDLEALPGQLRWRGLRRLRLFFESAEPQDASAFDVRALRWLFSSKLAAQLQHLAIEQALVMGQYDRQLARWPALDLHAWMLGMPPTMESVELVLDRALRVVVRRSHTEFLSERGAVETLVRELGDWRVEVYGLPELWPPLGEALARLS